MREMTSHTVAVVVSFIRGPIVPVRDPWLKRSEVALFMLYISYTG